MSLRIVFMGTPEFAVASLQQVLQMPHKVVAVITAPDKPKGRGRKLIPSPVKSCAVEHGVPVLQPPNLKAPEFIEQLKNLQANLQVVVAFRMLPEVVWSMPRLGTFNLHASLLPQYRGAAPIHWAIINGETETGVTTFLLKQEIDTGDIIFQDTEVITPDDTVGTLYERLMHKGANLVVKTIDALHLGNVELKSQSVTGEIKLAPKIFKETCRINWEKSSREIVNFVRGLNPFPGAWTIFRGKTYKIFGCHVPVIDAVNNQKKSLDEQYITDNKSYLWFKTGDGWLAIDEWQPEAKRRMKIQDYLRGNPLES